jgi:hypothetical protein
MTVSQFKSHFPEVLDLVQHGEDIVISYGKKKEKIAVRGQKTWQTAYP